MTTVNTIPTTYPRVTPHLAIEGSAEAVEFYKSLLGADERMRMALPDGTVAHAELQLGDSVLMLAEASPADPGPKALGGSPITLFVYVDDVDAVHDRAVARGATSVAAPENHFYGDRVATIEDPYGHRWNLATHVEDLDPAELERSAADVVAAADR
jgi:PhnB protein